MLLVGESVGVWPAERPVNFDKLAKGPSVVPADCSGVDVDATLVAILSPDGAVSVAKLDGEGSLLRRFSFFFFLSLQIIQIQT